MSTKTKAFFFDPIAHLENREQQEIKPRFRFVTAKGTVYDIIPSGNGIEIVIKDNRDFRTVIVPHYSNFVSITTISEPLQ